MKKSAAISLATLTTLGSIFGACTKRTPVNDAKFSDVPVPRVCLLTPRGIECVGDKETKKLDLRHDHL